MNKVYIAVPTKSGNMYFELALTLLSWADQKTIPIMVHVEPFAAPIDHARNTIVQKFLGTSCTHLMMIDDDIVPPKDALERLLFHDRDIVAAVCPLIGPDNEGKLKVSYNAYDMEGSIYVPKMEDKGLHEVDGVGTGCILIKREVLENIPYPFMTQYNEDGTKWLGEDLYFCREAKGVMAKVYADYSCECKHIKQVNLQELWLN
jgi:hypothetical protein